MKPILLVLALLLTACGPLPEPKPVVEAKKELPEGCTYDTSSNLVTEHKVGPITNLVTEEHEFGARNECTVIFDITVNGEQRHVEHTAVGLEQMDSMCYQAREQARNNLLLNLGGKFKSEASITCRVRES